MASTEIFVGGKGSILVGAFPLIESVKSYLIIHQIDGLKSNVTAEIVNSFELVQDFTTRYACLVSVLAVRNK